MNYPNNVGRTMKYNTATGIKMKIHIDDEIIIPETDYPNKLLCFQKALSVTGEFYRLGYYILSQKGDRWIWGKNAAYVSVEDLKLLNAEARKRNWDI